MEIHCEYLWILSTFSARCLQCVAPVLLCCSLGDLVLFVYGGLWKSNQFEDVSPIKNPDFPYMSLFRGPCRVPSSLRHLLLKGRDTDLQTVENRVDLSWAPHTKWKSQNCSIMKMDETIPLGFLFIDFLKWLQYRRIISGIQKKNNTLSKVLP